MNRSPILRLYALGLLLSIHIASISGQVELATDGPKPLSPEESSKSFELPPGFRIDLIVSEPLIQAPSGVCWDAAGQMYVSELHGYNLEGHYDIEELNKTGELDRVVRRIQANESAKEKAETGTFGVIKILRDADGDGRMDEATVFAKDLPPCFGIVPARNGIIAVCAPHIIYLVDTDNDGISDVREILFSGFEEGVLERRINAPQWGLDNWIYIGGGGRADHITGPNLKEPVALGRTDFRIKPDGSAIEAVGGHTGTFGHTYTGEGDRITISTGTPGYQVIPLPWHYLKRNPDLAIPSMERNAASYQKTFPISKPHPWRTRRYEDPGFSKFYTDRYGLAESYPAGYFTSACSPFIYRDYALPEYYRGANFTCEPAQNMVHLSKVQWDGPVMHLVRGGINPDPADVKGWAQRTMPTLKVVELPATSHWQMLGPFSGNDKNSLFENDLGPEYLFEEEERILGRGWKDQKSFEDDSLIDLKLDENTAVYLHRTLTSEEDITVYASLGSNDSIKCWFNGKVVLENNVNRGLAADQELVALPVRKGNNSFLLKIINGTNASGFYFRLMSNLIPGDIRTLIKKDPNDWTDIEYKLAENYYQSIQSEKNKSEFLASTDSWFHPINLTHGPDGSIYIVDFYREIIEDYSAIPRYLQQQYGLTNGMHHGRIWRLSHESMTGEESFGYAGHPNALLATEVVGEPNVWGRETARRLLIERKATGVKEALDTVLEYYPGAEAGINSLYTLKGLNVLNSKSINLALKHPFWAVRRHALIVGDAYPEGGAVKSAVEKWLSNPKNYGSEPRLLLQIALSLGAIQNEKSLTGLEYLANKHLDVNWMEIAIASSSFNREAALLEKLLINNKTGNRLTELLVRTLAARKDNLQLTRAVSTVSNLATGTSRDHYLSILTSSMDGIPQDVIDNLPHIDSLDNQLNNQIKEKWPSYLSALTKNNKVNDEDGAKLYNQYCASCHKAKGIGLIAGPNLDSEFQRARETILRDILFPNETISEGYQTVRLQMKDGNEIFGLLASESPTSLTLRFPGGQEITFLRRNINKIRSHPVSMMPQNFGEILKPGEIASIIQFLRHRPE